MSARDHAPNFRAVLDAIQTERYNAGYDACVAAMVAADERQADLRARRNFLHEQRKYSAVPVAITDFGAFYNARVVALLAKEDEPLLTPEQRAEEDYADFRQLQDQERAHGLE